MSHMSQPRCSRLPAWPVSHTGPKARRCRPRRTRRANCVASPPPPKYPCAPVGALSVDKLAYQVPGGRTLFKDVSFSVGNGSVTALVGDNGVGKTTLLRLLAG